MNLKKKEITLLVFLLIILLAINYPFLNRALENFLIEKDVVFVERVIDGDTFVIENTSVRLLGINSPERGQEYYDEAKVFLENLVLNKTVRLEFGKDKRDKYGRTLAYIYINRENINLKLIEKGFANFYFPSGKDEYYNEFRNAWEECVKRDINLCEESDNKCSSCIKLKEFDYKNQIVIFQNTCTFSCELTSWSIKDEGRKIFVFENFALESNQDVSIVVDNGTDSSSKLYWDGEDYVWTASGDTLFLRDDEGKIILWESY